MQGNLHNIACCYIIPSMNVVQERILKLADTVDIGAITYYQLAKDLDVDHPYKVKYAIEQLIKKGYLLRNLQTGSISRAQDDTMPKGLINVPYYGEVNCGEALTFADDQVQGFLKVSPSVINSMDMSNIFALKAVGLSMNQASINGKSVNEGDYVIARKLKNGYSPKNGDYVVSIIWGAANLKRFYKDNKNRQLLLVSQSTEDLLPIVISEQDADEQGAYTPIAEAIDVVTMPTMGVV